MLQKMELAKGQLVNSVSVPVISQTCALTSQLGAISKVTERYRRHGRYISPSVDNFARIIFALIGGLFLLIPMITLAFITSKTYLIVTTSLFIVVFAVSLGLFSKGSNQE